MEKYAQRAGVFPRDTFSPFFAATIAQDALFIFLSSCSKSHIAKVFGIIAARLSSAHEDDCVTAR